MAVGGTSSEVITTGVGKPASTAKSSGTKPKAKTAGGVAVNATPIQAAPVQSERAIIEEMFQRTRTVAVVGLSDKIDRPSYGVADYLHRFYSIIPVNPQIRSFQGIPAFPDLKSIPAHIQIDLVDIFRRSDQVMEVVDEAIARGGVKYIWMQQGISDPKAAEKARKAGIKVIMNACIKIERAKYT